MKQLHVSAAVLGPEYETSGPIKISIEDGRISAIDPARQPDGPALHPFGNVRYFWRRHLGHGSVLPRHGFHDANMQHLHFLDN